ncbi:MAG: hypothetical protein ABJN84_13195 [Flavobacteriaceae bacterium]
MVTGISVITFIAFYLLYCTSAKMAVTDVSGMEKWVGNHKSLSKYIGLALLIISMCSSFWHWGLGSGAFSFFVLLMVIASLTVLLAPLRLLNYRFLVFFFTFFLITEFIFF